MAKYSKDWWAQWIKAAGIRAVKTAAQTAAATIGAGAFLIHEVNWLVIGSAAAGAAALSLMMSLAGLPEIKTEEDTENE